MEATHVGHEHHEGHLGHDDHDWSDETFVAGWIERQEAQAPQRRHLFARLSALIPKDPSEPFRYLNLGAGAGDLDEMILQRFPEAEAVLLDSSMPMLAHARKRLAPFEDRVEYVQADLSHPKWVGGASGPYEVVLSSRAIHHAGDGSRIRRLFGEIAGVLGHGGLFLNLDYVRLARPSFQDLGAWAATHEDAGFQGGAPHMELPSSAEEQLAWLREVGFAAAECVYREFQTVIVVGIRDHLHLPHSAGNGGDHGH